MTPYEKFVLAMRKQGSYHNPPTIQIGTVLPGKKISFGGLELKPKDYLLNSALIMDDTEYWTYRENNRESALYQDKREVVKAGDKVALLYMEKKNRFLVLMKVVEVV